MTKKNLMMRIASVLLIAVVLTTSVIGGTLAKYTSTATVTASKAVAKWSIQLEGQEMTVPGPAISIDLSETFKEYDGVTEETHVANTLLAPGTSGSFDFTIMNTSEVTATYSIALEEAIANRPISVSEESFPIEYSTNKTHWSTDITTVPTSGTLAINETATVTVYWRWAFEGSDVIDTALGVAAQTPAPTVTVTATITATQVD